MVELVIVVALIGIMAAVAIPYILKVLRRQRFRGTVQEIYSLVLATRMQAVKRNQNVVMFIDLTNRRIVTWADNLPYNFKQDPGPAPPAEPTINIYNIPRYVYFRFAPDGAAVDDADSVAFDKYIGDASLTNLIVFQGDGTLVPPQAAGSGPPVKPSAITSTVPVGSINCNDVGGTGRCRGIYISDKPDTGDVPNRNTFRISVDDFGSTGKASFLKWIPSPPGIGGEKNYVPGPWIWAD